MDNYTLGVIATGVFAGMVIRYLCYIFLSPIVLVILVILMASVFITHLFREG